MLKMMMFQRLQKFQVISQNETVPASEIKEEFDCTIKLLKFALDLEC